MVIEFNFADFTASATSTSYIMVINYPIEMLSDTSSTECTFTLAYWADEATTECDFLDESNQIIVYDLEDFFVVNGVDTSVTSSEWYQLTISNLVINPYFEVNGDIYLSAVLYEDDYSSGTQDDDYSDGYTSVSSSMVQQWALGISSSLTVDLVIGTNLGTIENMFTEDGDIIVYPVTTEQIDLIIDGTNSLKKRDTLRTTAYTETTFDSDVHLAVELRFEYWDSSKTNLAIDISGLTADVTGYYYDSVSGEFLDIALGQMNSAGTDFVIYSNMGWDSSRPAYNALIEYTDSDDVDGNEYPDYSSSLFCSSGICETDS